MIASDHTDHTMYLQCSWGTSVCLCNDKRHSPNHTHCSIHSAEREPSYSHLAKGKLCTAKLKSDKTIYICKVKLEIELVRYLRRVDVVYFF